MKNYRYDGSKNFSIKGFDCGETGEFNERHEAISEFISNLEKINEYQQKLFAEQKEGIIFVFQAMDAAGKDGAVRAVLSCLSPQGVSEHSFKVPSAEENRHDFLWRFWDAIPEKGSISIFNRSYYEDVLVQKVHEIYRKNKYADRIDLDTMIDKRYEQIRNFEKYLWENSIRVVKIFLNVSRDEQAKRFISRIDTQKKNWKFSSGDIDERSYWEDYMKAYETAINRTARKNAPWYVVPADHKWYARLVISRIVLTELENMDPKWPVLGDDEMAKLGEYRELLINELGEDKDIKAADDVGNESGEKLRPSDTAIGIALKSDRQALSEKKFRKLLEKSVFDNFSERFGVTAETREKIGEIYFGIEEAEAMAEADSLAVVKNVYKENKKILEDELKNRGKEARKLLAQYKKASKAQIGEYIEGVILSYTDFEEKIKQLMVDYEIAVVQEGSTPEEALIAFDEKLHAAYDEHRAAAEDSRAQTEAGLTAVAAEYSAIGKVFSTEPEAEAEESVIPEEDAAAADADVETAAGDDTEASAEAAAEALAEAAAEAVVPAADENN